MDSRFSVFLIKPFIKGNGISLADYETQNWASFNRFFTRRVKEGKRVFDPDPSALVSPCDGLLMVYPISEDLKFTVKNSVYTVEDLLESGELAEEFSGGTCLVFRLTPSHYHRYFYIDGGEKGENTAIPGIFHTVQPIAVENVPVYTRNSRQYTILKTENFGEVLFMEVGAMLVGRIVNHHGCHKCFRGEEKGYFEFGGSTIILLLKAGAAGISDFVTEKNRGGLECPVTAGQKIGYAKTEE